MERHGYARDDYSTGKLRYACLCGKLYGGLTALGNHRLKMTEVA